MQRLWTIVQAVTAPEYEESLDGASDAGLSDLDAGWSSGNSSDEKRFGSTPTGVGNFDKEAEALARDRDDFDTCVSILRRFADGGLAAVQAGKAIDRQRETESATAFDNGDLLAQDASSPAAVVRSRGKAQSDWHANAAHPPAGLSSSRRSSSSGALVISTVAVSDAAPDLTVPETDDETDDASSNSVTAPGEVRLGAAAALVDGSTSTVKLASERVVASPTAIPENSATEWPVLEAVSGMDSGDLTSPKSETKESSTTSTKVADTSEPQETLTNPNGNSADFEESRSDAAFVVDSVATSLSTLATVMVRGDRNNHAIWDRFMEFGLMKLFHMCLERTAELPVHQKTKSQPQIVKLEPTASAPDAKDNATPSLSIQQPGAVRIQSQVLRTLSILVHSVHRRESLHCLFASNHINNILSFPFEFSDDEVLLYFTSTAKSIGSRLDDSLVQLFYNSDAETFPLYTSITRFHAHSDGMVRIAVRNLTLTVYTLKNPAVTGYAVRETNNFLSATVDRLARLSGDVARGFEFLMDDGREERLTVSRRVNRLRFKIRMPQFHAQLAEVDNLIEYLNDVMAIGDSVLSGFVTELLAQRFFGPFFRPIASQASPRSVTMAKKRWGFKSGSAGDVEQIQPAISAVDGAARATLLALLLNVITNATLGTSLFTELTKETNQFDRRTALHGLRAMASDLCGRERTTLVALCALEAILRCDCLPADVLGQNGFSFEHENSEENENKSAEVMRMSSFSREDSALSEPSTSSAGDTIQNTMVMSLTAFRAPLTPTAPLTPGASREQMLQISTSVEDSSQTSPSDISRHAEQESDAAENSSAVSAPDDGEDEDILASFRNGEASIREVVSAILLVVRIREVRTVRLTQSVVRIISGIGLRSGNWRLSLDVAKIALDEMASAMVDFLASDRTTIVSLEAAFDNFLAASQEGSEACLPVPDLWTVLHIDAVVNLATVLPADGGLRRRSASLGNSASPIERSDANSFFVLLLAYERILAEVLIAGGIHAMDPPVCNAPLLYQRLTAILQDKDVVTYLDKKEVLERFAHQTLNFDFQTRLDTQSQTRTSCDFSN